MKNKKPCVLFLSHGGGPMPLLGDKGHKELVKTLKIVETKIKKPSAVMVISAHWEEKTPTITARKTPSLIYDYYGFPKESYDIKYPCPGESLLAKEVLRLLGNEGIDARMDVQRGFDHGVYVPLKIMCPKADVPCIQLSLIQGLNPTEHVNIGIALAGLMCEELLVIGSGFRFTYCINSNWPEWRKHEGFHNVVGIKEQGGSRPPL